MKTEITRSVWYGCYDDGWGDLITPESYAHPAKMARGLVYRIVKHGIDQSVTMPLMQVSARLGQWLTNIDAGIVDSCRYMILERARSWRLANRQGASVCFQSRGTRAFSHLDLTHTPGALCAGGRSIKSLALKSLILTAVAWTTRKLPSSTSYSENEAAESLLNGSKASLQRNTARC